MVFSVANKPEVIDGQLKNLWIYGPAGCGKSSWVWNNIPSDQLYVKNANKWWDNYKNEPYVLIEDLDKKRCENLTYYLKIWADRYPFSGEMKGAGRKMRP